MTESQLSTADSSVAAMLNVPSPASCYATDHDIVADTVFKSVVKLFVSSCAPNYRSPWQMSIQSHSSSSGFIISNRRILCNAHGVRYARSIRVRKHGDSKKYDAAIQHIAHCDDLAILTVKSERFWRNLLPLQFESKTPKLQDTVVVVGYPMGGDAICVTKGVVSRLGFITYSHALSNQFAIQIDAAINAGNSGGPTIMRNKVIGVAFSGYNDAQNIGYCIPIRVVLHFLHDVEMHGRYTRFPQLGIRWQRVENASLKKYLKMVDDDFNPNNSSDDGEDDDDEEDDGKDDANEDMSAAVQMLASLIDVFGTENSSSDRSYSNCKAINKKKKKKKKKRKAMEGILVNVTYPLTDMHDKLKPNDAILSIDGVDVGEDGTIPYPFPSDGVSRISFCYITSNKYCGDTVNLKVLRDGEIIQVNTKIDFFDNLVPPHLYEKDVSYYIFGGFVFLSLSRPYLQAEYGSKWSSKCAVRFKDLYFNGFKKKETDEVVILSRVLACNMNAGYHKIRNLVLEKINDVEIENMRQLIAVIEDIIQHKRSRFINFLFEKNSYSLVLEIEHAIEAMAQIMEQHKIKSDRSPNLL
eukprot:CAMPEP_0202694320 /NCGR_PEP_ID=MMETSP1385-20130828/8205_1 /ASSEMBLY_ACC=CAM_ASM_000861 /TAXON_ID=933848 /ORGANISM="Elphidium margaritaceum" /LENGTH=580 /DNA_ID=CAMNT_0049350139 /DNA_START=13 /DNA_END=1755 /DNA_ORIENTATION=+